MFPTLDAAQLLDNFEVLRDNLTDSDQVRASCDLRLRAYDFRA